MWSAIKGLFSMDNAINHVSSGIDKAFFTDEERSDNWMRALALYEPFKIAQRLLSLGMFSMISLSLILSIGLRVIGNMTMTPEWVEMANGAIVTHSWWVDDSEWIMTQAIALFGEPYLWSIAFYFGGGAFEGIATKMAGRRDKLRESSK